MGSLITDSYREQMKELHKSGRFGIKGHIYAPDVMHIAMQSGSKTILDYGCGQGHLKKSITLPVREYDPAIPGKDSPPLPADLVVCCDVLEHIEPDCLEDVLNHLRCLTNKLCYAVVHLTPAIKVLPDGRNAHLILEDVPWWKERLSKHFRVLLAQGSKAYKEVAFLLEPIRG